MVDVKLSANDGSICEAGRFKLKQAAEDVVKEYEDRGFSAWIYKGHREYVVQYRQI